MPEQKFLLIREIGAGLWNEIHHVLTQLLAAEIMQRIPVVYWGKGSLYASADGSNAFEEFFMPVSDYCIDDLARKEFTYYPGGWNSENIKTPTQGLFKSIQVSADYIKECDADVCVQEKYIDTDRIIPFIPENHWLFGIERRDLLNRLINKYIHLRKDIQNTIDAFYNENMKGTPLLAVHIRSSDKIVEVQHLHELNKRYPREIEKVLQAQPGVRIFLMTDSIEILEEYRKRYGNLLIYTDCRRVSGNGPGVHYQKYKDNRIKGLEVILDTWLAAKCDYFIGNGYSNVSLGIYELKNWGNDRVRLLY